MTSTWRGALTLTAIGVIALSSNAIAQSPHSETMGALEWRNFDAKVDGKQLIFRFPVDVRPQSLFKFDPEPTADRYTKIVDIIGVQANLDIGPRFITTDFTLNLALVPTRSLEIGRRVRDATFRRARVVKSMSR